MNMLQHAWQRARRRRAAITLLLGLPFALAATALALRLAGFDIACVVATLTAVACAALATARARQLDQQWLQRRLDASGQSEDSADLLFASTATLNPLQQRQRTHVLALLQRAPLDLRPRWPHPALALCWAAGIAIAVLALAWPRSAAPVARTPATARATAITTPLQLQASRLRIEAPAYTGQPSRTQGTLDAKLAAGSRLAWSLQFNHAPRKAWLQFHDGQRLPLSEHHGRWQAEATVQVSRLYRVVSEPALAATRLHRLEVVADRAPSVRVLEPAANLVTGTPGQRHWALRFEASDDYSVSTRAKLVITLTQGSGENINFIKRELTLTGSGKPTTRRFAHTLDLAALGAEPGNDVIARLEVRDNRAPTPQTGRSSSVILRLPTTEAVLGAELESRIKKTLPAYFRSQRQIIIDAEALIRQRSNLAAEDFVKRSDAIGVDQRILRLRYGQFLGEESEGAPKPPPTSDLPTSDVPATDDHDDHDHGSASASADTPPVFGSATDVLSEYGHTHDHAEAATLLDPQTRATLKAALDQMWSAEGELRQGRPEQALPFAYKALGFIKQVQQAERIYLARVGPELPPIDEGRRLGGERTGLASRELPLAARTPPDPAIIEAWQQLGDADTTPDLDALAAWQQRNAAYLPDALDLAAAIEQLRIEPDCHDCRQRLRAQLWRALQRPLPQALRRHAVDAMGQRYLDALEAQP